MILSLKVFAATILAVSGIACAICSSPVFIATSEPSPSCAESASEHATDTESVPEDGSFDETLLEIAREYRDWGPVDAEASWAPILCRRPLPSDLQHVEFRFSDSDDETTHGQKIYLLYARDREAYRKVASTPSSVGQAIVKQAWRPVESTEDVQSPEGLAKLRESLGEQGFPNKHTILVDGREQEIPVSPFVHRGRQKFHADELDSLFIMFKSEPENEATDNGWVYGTVTADGKTVTSSGRVEQCMACHVDAGEDRLFGLPTLLGRQRNEKE